MFAQRVKELEELLSKEKEEKTIAQEKLQRYCDQIVVTRLLKTKLDEKLSNAEALKNEAREEGKRIALTKVDSHLKAATEAGREETKCIFDLFVAEYNARVLRHRDLTFLDEGYLESLVEACDTLIKIKKVESGTEEIDEEALVKEFLQENEPSDLSAAKALYSKDDSSSKGRNDTTSPSGTESPVPPSIQPTGRPSLDPFE